MSRKYTPFPANFFFKKYSCKILFYICRQWNGTGSWNSPLRNARTWLFAWSITLLLMAWWCKYPRHQQAWYEHGIDLVCTLLFCVPGDIFLKQQWFLFNSIENSPDCVQQSVIDSLVIVVAPSFAKYWKYFPVTPLDNWIVFPVLNRGYLW